MKTITLTPLPTHPGIYALVNHRTKQIYIGQTKNLCYRYATWVHEISTKPRWAKDLAADAIRASIPGDWMFTVMYELPHAKRAELLAFEEKAICRALRLFPDGVLNSRLGIVEAFVPKGPPPTAHPKNGRPEKTTILSHAGERLSYRETADRLGCKMTTLTRRLHDHRDKGVMTVLFEDLERRQKKFRPKLPQG